jgi:hypothetical protein
MAKGLDNPMLEALCCPEMLVVCSQGERRKYQSLSRRRKGDMPYDRNPRVIAVPDVKLMTLRNLACEVASM